MIYSLKDMFSYILTAVIHPVKKVEEKYLVRLLILLVNYKVVTIQ